MRCDLRVHSLHSGTLPVAILRHFFLESYSAPKDVYSTLRQRGMDLVTLTDHDSISGAEELRRYPDFFVSEEVTCTMPSGTQAHVGVYDITERQHVEINRRRNDMIRLLAYLSEQRLFFTVNHVFSSVTGRRNADDYEWFSGYFPAVEARNGQMLASANQHAADFAWKRCKTQVAGSDAHALASVGTTYTEVPGARNKEEFFAGPARRKRPALRRIGRLLEIDARYFAALRRNDARGPLDCASGSARRSGPRRSSRRLLRRSGFCPPLGYSH